MRSQYFWKIPREMNRMNLSKWWQKCRTPELAFFGPNDIKIPRIGSKIHFHDVKWLLQKCYFFILQITIRDWSLSKSRNKMFLGGSTYLQKLPAFTIKYCVNLNHPQIFKGHSGVNPLNPNTPKSFYLGKNKPLDILK